MRRAAEARVDAHRHVRISMARGADGMERGADGMERGADRMEAKRHGSPATATIASARSPAPASAARR